MFGWLLIPALLLAAPQDSISSYWSRLSGLEQVAAVQAAAAEYAPGSVEQSLGLVRVFQITRSEKDGDAAERVLKKVLDDRERDPWLQFGLGEVLAIKSPRKFPLRASKYLLNALRLDSMHVPAAAALGRLALISREEELLVEAQRASERIVRHLPSAELLNNLAAIAREQRDENRQRASAAAAVKTYPASGAARYQLGVAQMLDPKTRKEGYANYLAAAEMGDPTLLRLIRTELGFIGEPDELPNFEDQSIRPSKQIEKFWNIRAARDGRTPVERASEHYRRIAHAREKFQAKWSRTDADFAFDWNQEGTQLGYDDRGKIYIRYGEPSEIIRSLDRAPFGERRERASDVEKGPIMSNAGAAPTSFFETWIYEFPYRERIYFHFQLPNQAGRGFVISLIPGCGTWLNTHYSLNGQYQLLATKCGSGSAPEWSVLATLRDMNEVYKQNVSEALKSDAYVPKYRKELLADAELYAFRGPNGEREFALAAAAAADRFNVRLMVADTTVDVVMQMDTVLDVTRRPDQFASIVHTFALTGNVHAPFFRLNITDAADESIGMAFGGNVPTYLMKGFDISDVVLGDTARSGNFQRGDVRFMPLPGRITSESSFKAYYEIYGLPPGTEFQTELTFEPIDNAVKTALRRLRGEEAVTLSFKNTYTSLGYRQQELRTIQTALSSGTYRLTIVVRDLRNGAEAIKQRIVRVR